jgi:hypothetical protein
VIQNAPTNVTPGAVVQVSGTQFNGLSQAVAYGDDVAMATNYPLVRMTKNANDQVTYCRTSNHTTVNSQGNTVPSMGVATGAAVITTTVNIPSSLPPGAYSLVVVANGIASDPVSVRVTEPDRVFARAPDRVFARKQALTPAERRAVKAAGTILAEESGDGPR